MQNIEKNTNLWPEPEPVRTEKMKLVDDDEHNLVWREVVMVMIVVVIIAGAAAEALKGM